MDKSNSTLDLIFKMFEEKAKDPNVSDQDLIDNISYFLQTFEYERNSYNMKFEGFYRARAGDFKSIDDACIEFGNTKRLSFPPDAAARACRCNPNGHAVFYASSETGVPVFEVRPQKGQYIAVTAFYPTKKNRLELTVPIIGVKQIREGLQKFDRQDAMIKILEADMHFKQAHNLTLEIDSRIAEWFVTKVDETQDNQHIYRLSTAFYKGLVKYALTGDHKVQSLIYPSVESGISGYNIVMEKEIAKDFLEVRSSTIYRVENKIPNVIFLRPLKSTRQIGADGDIVWEEAENSHRLWALESRAPVHYGSVNDIKNRISKFPKLSNQYNPNAYLGF